MTAPMRPRTGPSKGNSRVNMLRSRAFLASDSSISMSLRAFPGKALAMLDSQQVTIKSVALHQFGMGTAVGDVAICEQQHAVGQQ